MILDSADEFGIGDLDTATKTLEDSPKLLVFSANTQDSLRRLVERYHEYIDLHPERLSDVAHMLSLRREKLPHRSFAIGGGGLIPTASASTKIPTTPPDIVMMFSGQGAQWPEMGRELIRTNRGFREDIMAMDNILQSMTHPPEWTIEGKIPCDETIGVFLKALQKNSRNQPKPVR